MICNKCKKDIENYNITGYLWNVKGLKIILCFECSEILNDEIVRWVNTKKQHELKT